MKKLIILLITMAMLLSITACSTSEKQSEVIELSFAHFFPGTHPVETV